LLTNKNKAPLTDTAIADIISRFKINGKVISARPFGTGHINDTYRVITDTKSDYLLQRINHFVFKDVPGLMNNLVKVTQHLKEKLKTIPGANPDKEVLTLIENKTTGYYFEDTEGNFWRVFTFLKDTKSYDQVLTTAQAFEGGKAFGKFQALLSDLDTRYITDTIPNFHNVNYRLQNLDRAIAADDAKRLSKVLPEIEWIEERKVSMGTILKLGNNGALPQRIIHNDTKFNNVLLDMHDKAQCVIDLDTVMPGYVAYDFGDAIRTIVNKAPEDEPDLNLITLNIPLFTAYTKGYLQQAVSFLTQGELNSLIEGVLLLPYTQYVRFLTDYIDGDRYYKIHSPQHNLQRARAQFQLLKKLEEAKDQLTDIILKTWNKYKKGI
jgi:hypothetical protein